MNKNMANRMCCDLDIRDYYTKVPIMKVDFCNTTTYGFTSDSIYAKRNGSNYIRFDDPIEGNIDITFQVHPFQVYSLLNGGQILSDAIITRHENVVAKENGKLALKHSPVMGSVFVYPDSDFTGEEIKGTVASQIFTAITSSDIKKGESYSIGYLEQANKGVKRISFHNRNYSSIFFIQMLTMNKTEDDENSALRLTAYKCCPKRELEITFSSDDSPAEITMSFECFQDDNDNVMDIVELEDEVIEVDTDDIWIDFTTGRLMTYNPTYYIKNGYLLQNEVKEEGY